MRAVLCNRQISDKMQFSPRNAGYRKYSTNEFHEYSHSRPHFKAKSTNSFSRDEFFLIGTVPIYLEYLFARTRLNSFFKIIFYSICF